MLNILLVTFYKLKFCESGFSVSRDYSQTGASVQLDFEALHLSKTNTTV